MNPSHARWTARTPCGIICAVMSDNAQEGSPFVFVDASTDDEDKSYGNKPAYPYVFKAWEWLLERMLRRRIILSYYDKDAALAALALRTKVYRLHRWPAYENSHGCTSFRDSHFTQQYPYCHDGTLKTYQNESLPTGGINSSTGKLYVSSTETFSNTVYGIYSLVSGVEALLRDSRFLAPDWTPAEYRVNASLAETTTGTRDSSTGRWTWTTSATSTPYTIPSAPFFRLLSDTRVDDPLVTVSVEDSEGYTRRVKLAKTLTALKTPDDLRDFDGEKVLYAGYSGVNTDSILSFKNKTDMVNTDGSMISEIPYDDAGGRTGATDAVGVIKEPVPRAPGSAVYVAFSRRDNHVGWLQPNVDWDGEPTWWHANGFPKGLSSIVSDKLRGQLEALSVTQPAVPPCIPHAFSFPKDGYDCFEDGTARYGIYAGFSSWPGNTLSLAATPHCVHKMLDALKTTVLQVPALFFEIDTETRESHRSENTYTSDGYTESSWTLTESEEHVSGTRTAANILGCDGAQVSDEWDETDTTDMSGTSSGSGWQTSWSDVTTDRYTKAKTSTLASPVALRSTTSSVQTSTRTVKDETTTGTYYDRPWTRHSESGSEPGVKDPAEADLMFPDWLRKWIAKAELFLAYETKVNERNPHTEEYSDTTTSADGQETTKSYTGSGSGSRTTKAAKGVVSLGEMDLETGKFPDIDLVDLRSIVDPPVDAGHRVNGGSDSTSVKTYTSVTADGKLSATETNEWTYTWKPGADYARESSLFVVVEWKFDEESPEQFGEQIAERKAWLDAQKALQTARDGLVAAQDAKRSAENEVEARERELQEAIERADAAPQDEEAARAVEEARARLADANATLQAAEAAIEEKEQAVEDAQQDISDRKDEYVEAIKGYEGRRR